ncbi:MAG: diguanylate cyclase domain-containing protein [Pseudomonadota bacterium]
MTDRICSRRIGKFFCHRRYWAIPLAVWSLVVAASLLRNVQTMQRHSEDIALQQARFVSQMIETFRLWNAGHGGVYVHADEFALLIAGLTRLENVDRVAEKVLESVGRPYTLDGREVRISASVGVAVYPRDGDDGATLLQQADAAMYRAKRSGKNDHRHAHAATGPDTRDGNPV